MEPACAVCVSQVSVLLYHGTQPERAKLLKQIRRPQGSLNMCPVVVTSFEISMIDRKFLQVRNTFAWIYSLGSLEAFYSRAACGCVAGGLCLIRTSSSTCDLLLNHSTFSKDG